MVRLWLAVALFTQRYLSVIGFALAGVTVHLQSSGCNSNLTNILSGMPLTTGQIRTLMGIWYPCSFYANTASDITYQQQKKNVVDLYTAFNNTRMPFSNTPAVVVTQVKTWNDAITDQCLSLYEPCVFSTNGWQASTASYNADGSSAAADKTLILYTDFSSLVLFVECFDRNLDTGNCDSSYLYASTRVRGDQLSQSQQEAISATLNQQVVQYGLSSSCFTSRVWTGNDTSGGGSSDACPNNTNPTCYLSHLGQLNIANSTTF